jgi:hypothetical protein
MVEPRIERGVMVCVHFPLLLDCRFSSLFAAERRLRALLFKYCPLADSESASASIVAIDSPTTAARVTSDTQREQPGPREYAAPVQAAQCDLCKPS